MPELPEVESTVRYLRERIVGSAIVAADVRWARTVDRPGVVKFKKNVVGSIVSAVSRRGKFIVMALDRSGEAQKFLISHLRMSGSMDVVKSASPLAKHDRLVIQFASGKDLRFHDPRKFGRFYLVNEVSEITGKLGYEPLDPLLDATRFYQLLREKRGTLKPLLLNQTFLAGVGNIYADECLWQSGLHPRRQASSVSEREAACLLNELRKILIAAIAAKGTDFSDGVVDEGLYEPKAYARDGQPCLKCKTLLKRIVVSQRGTHFCPKCQNIRPRRKNNL